MSRAPNVQDEDEHVTPAEAHCVSLQLSSSACRGTYSAALRAPLVRCRSGHPLCPDGNAAIRGEGEAAGHGVR